MRSRHYGGRRVAIANAERQAANLGRWFEFTSLGSSARPMHSLHYRKALSTSFVVFLLVASLFSLKLILFSTEPSLVRRAPDQLGPNDLGWTEQPDGAADLGWSKPDGIAATLAPTECSCSSVCPVINTTAEPAITVEPPAYKPITLQARDDLGVQHVGILYICTGKYVTFLPGFFESFESHFLPSIRKSYFIFTDANRTSLPSNITSRENVFLVATAFIGWPYETLYRFHRFNAAKDIINASRVEYLYFVNANAICVQNVSTAILPGKENGYFVATLHPGYFNSRQNSFPYERNSKSLAYVAPGDGKYYFQGALYGARTAEFMEFSFLMEYWVRGDERRGIIPVWHDESVLNRFLLGSNPLILPPSYINPEGWNLGHGLSEIIRTLDKGRLGGHAFLRGVGGTGGAT